MWQDPIVKETRELREEYAEKLNHDPEPIFDDILKRQSQPDKSISLYPHENPHLHAVLDVQLLADFDQRLTDYPATSLKTVGGAQ